MVQYNQKTREHLSLAKTNYNIKVGELKTPKGIKT